MSRSSGTDQAFLVGQTRETSDSWFEVTPCKQIAVVGHQEVRT